MEWGGKYTSQCCSSGARGEESPSWKLWNGYSLCSFRVEIPGLPPLPPTCRIVGLQKFPISQEHSYRQAHGNFRACIWKGSYKQGVPVCRLFATLRQFVAIRKIQCEEKRGLELLVVKVEGCCTVARITTPSNQILTSVIRAYRAQDQYLGDAEFHAPGCESASAGDERQVEVALTDQADTAILSGAWRT